MIEAKRKEERSKWTAYGPFTTKPILNLISIPNYGFGGLLAHKPQSLMGQTNTLIVWKLKIQAYPIKDWLLTNKHTLTKSIIILVLLISMLTSDCYPLLRAKKIIPQPNQALLDT